MDKEDEDWCEKTRVRTGIPHIVRYTAEVSWPSCQAPCFTTQHTCRYPLLLLVLLLLVLLLLLLVTPELQGGVSPVAVAAGGTLGAAVASAARPLQLTPCKRGSLKASAAAVRPPPAESCVAAVAHNGPGAVALGHTA